MEPRGALHSTILVTWPLPPAQGPPHETSDTERSDRVSPSIENVSATTTDDGIPSHRTLQRQPSSHLEYEEESIDTIRRPTASIVSLSHRRIVTCWRRHYGRMIRDRSWSFHWTHVALASLVVVSGVGTVVTAKLQAIPLYNYPNFVNLATSVLYIPICWAYIVPHSGTRTSSSSSARPAASPTPSPPRVAPWAATGTPTPSRTWMRRLVALGALDAMASTLQTYAAVYLPGPLLVVLPLAALPVACLISLYRTPRDTVAATQASSIPPMQCVGALSIVVGIGIILWPWWTHATAPSFVCEASPSDSNECATCRHAATEADCLATAFHRPTETVRNDTHVPVCQWISFGESTQEEEFLHVVWSVVVLASTVPMALSAWYKQRILRSLWRRQRVSLSLGSLESLPPVPSDSPHEPLLRTGMDTNDGTSARPISNAATAALPLPVVYVSGWIVMFQSFFSLVWGIPLGILLTPTARPWNVADNLWGGMWCYAGWGVVETTCHPDAQCASWQPALWVNLHVLCHVVYTLSYVLLWQAAWSRNRATLVGAVTAIVPLGHLVFALPILPTVMQTVMRMSDWIGLTILVLGLVVYRCTDPNLIVPRGHRKPFVGRVAPVDTSDSDEFDEDDAMEEPFWFHPTWPVVENQTSYTLLRAQIRTGDV